MIVWIAVFLFARRYGVDNPYAVSGALTLLSFALYLAVHGHFEFLNLKFFTVPAWVGQFEYSAWLIMITSAFAGFASLVFGLAQWFAENYLPNAPKVFPQCGVDVLKKFFKVVERPRGEVDVEDRSVYTEVAETSAQYAESYASEVVSQNIDGGSLGVFGQSESSYPNQPPVAAPEVPNVGEDGKEGAVGTSVTHRESQNSGA